MNRDNSPDKEDFLEDFEWWISRHREMWLALARNSEMTKEEVLDKLYDFRSEEDWPLNECYMCEFCRSADKQFTPGTLSCAACPLDWDSKYCVRGQSYTQFCEHIDRHYNAYKIATLPLKYEWIQAIYGKEQKLPRSIAPCWFLDEASTTDKTVFSQFVCGGKQKRQNNIVIESKDDLKQRKEKKIKIRDNIKGGTEMPKEEITTNDYLKSHKVSGFEIGDEVKVLRSAKDGEQGWNNIWNPSMDDYVGHTFTVTADHDSAGFTLAGGPFTFPWFVLGFVLELIEKKKHNPITIDFDTGCLDRELVEQAANSIANRKPLPDEILNSSYLNLFLTIESFCEDMADDFADADIITRLPYIFKVIERIIKYRSGWED